MLKGGVGLVWKKRSQSSAVHSTAFKKREHHSVFLSIIWIISLGACISQNFPFPCYSKYPLIGQGDPEDARIIQG